MSNRWIQAVSKNILPLSESRDVAVALKEWFYTGTCYDLEEPCEDCQLCDHQDIRYQFEIQNQRTSSTLLVGSECIARFSLEGVVAGQHLSVAQTSEKVHADRTKLINDARKKRVIDCLLQLGQAEQDSDFDFDCNDFITYLQDRGAFTPNQLALVFWRMNLKHISYTPTDFKLVMKRAREKSQLMGMPLFKLKHLFPAMTAPQREWVRKRRGL